MHLAQAAVNERWRAPGPAQFGLGIGLSTGRVAAALLGSEERLEYSLVGDAVNLAQRLQQWAEAGQTVVSEPTADALGDGGRAGAAGAGAGEGTGRDGARLPAGATAGARVTRDGWCRHHRRPACLRSSPGRPVWLNSAKIGTTTG